MSGSLRERNLSVPANLDASHRDILLRVFCHTHGKKVVLLLAINQAEISRIERGQINPTAGTLAALLAPLGARLGVVKHESRDLAHA